MQIVTATSLLDTRTAALVAHFLGMCVHGGSLYIDSSLSQVLVKLTQVLELLLLNNPLKAAAILVASAPFHTTPSPFSPSAMTFWALLCL